MRSFNFLCSTGLCLFILAGNQAEAEIQRVNVQWTAQLCQDSCVRGLRDQFLRQSGVADADINQSAGQATLRWKPNVPFTYTAIQNAMSMIGLHINTLRVMAKGRISHDSNSVRLTSGGDGTVFVLLGLIQPSPTQYVQKYNVATHQLNDDMRDYLLQFEQSDQEVSIDGPLFEPWRSPPMALQLIVEKIQPVENPQQ
jgi:hypothetical protein